MRNFLIGFLAILAAAFTPLLTDLKR